MTTRSDIRDPASHFATLLVRTDRALLRYIRTFVPVENDAEEVLQRTAVVLWEKFEEYDSTRDFLPWALRIAYFETLNFRKEHARSRLVFSPPVIDALAQTRDEENSYLDAQRGALRECLEKLTAEEMTLLQRRYVDAESIVELAKTMGKTAKSLYRRLDRIRDMIAGCVERRLAGTFPRG